MRVWFCERLFQSSSLGDEKDPVGLSEEFLIRYEGIIAMPQSLFVLDMFLCILM